MGKISTIFFLNRCPTSDIHRWGKNRMLFCCYCRYYSHYYYGMTTVVKTIVTTVATENRIMTHAIFSPSTDDRGWASFLKKSSFKDDVDDDNAKVCAALPSAKEQRAKNNVERSFSHIRHHHCDSRNLSGAHVGSSWVIKTFRKLRVSQPRRPCCLEMWEHAVTTIICLKYCQ